MKYLLLSTVVLAILGRPNAWGQEAAERKTVTLPVVNQKFPSTASALHIERGMEYPGVVKLTGNVEVRTPVCLPMGKKGATVCDGYTIVHADEAVFHEDTGRIDAHGNVTVTPLRHEPR